MPPLRVLISGASIAGPMTAYWFAHAGAQVTIVERYPSLRTGGQNIDIRSIGVSLLRKIPGFEAAVRARRFPLHNISFVDARGTPVATLGASGNPDAQSLISEYEILRGDLSAVLYDMTAGLSNVSYVFDEQIATLDQNDDGTVRVGFANGHLPPSTYDLVVACDGTTSRTRALAFACPVRAHMRPMNAWAAHFSMPGAPPHPTTAQALSAPGGRFIGLGPDHDPHTTRVTFMGMGPTASQAFEQAKAAGTPGLHAYISALFAPAGWHVPGALAAMPHASDFYASEVVQLHMPALHRGAVVLVGDAGYAPGIIGTGTTLAMAGAYVLAGEVCAHAALDAPRRAAALQAGLAAYTARMAPLIADLQRIPPGIPGVMAPQTAWGIWLRNLAFRVIAWTMRAQGLFQALLGGLLGRLAGWFSKAFAGDEFALPDYVFDGLGGTSGV